MTEVQSMPASATGVGEFDGTIHLSQGLSRKIASSSTKEGQFTEIPTIDLTALHSPTATEADKLQLIQQLQDACTRVGFFVIKNHGLDWNLVEDAFAAVKDFLDLPKEKKMKVHQSTSKYYQGYEEPYYTNLDRLKKGDLKESFTSSYDPFLDPDGVGDAMPELLRRDNNWPSTEDAPKLKTSIETYRFAAIKLMRNLCRALAVAIGEDPTFFDKKATYPSASIRALYYPPQEGSDEEETGFGAHTDVQLITLIAQNPYHVQALEVLNADGKWVLPKLEPETFVVNLGDIMARFTNDAFLSTVHRVRNKNTEGRYSLALFFGINNDELVKTRPQFVTPERPLVKGYERGITTYEHFKVRLQSAHHQHPSSTGLNSAALPYGMTKEDGVLVEGL